MNKPKKAPRYINFGILCIHRDKLYFDGKLIIRYIRSKARLEEIPEQILSEPLQECLIYIIENQAVDDEQIDDLNSEDIVLMETIMRRARMTETLNYKKRKKSRQMIIKDTKTRLNLLQGSVTAGSDSDEINDEIISLLKKLYEYNDITKLEYDNLKDCFK